jgi:hypothetical protein
LQEINKKHGKGLFKPCFGEAGKQPLFFLIKMLLDQGPSRSFSGRFWKS